jgi:hypothetical protein
MSSRVSDLLVLMTRVVRSDHRALCLHIAGNSLAASCQKQFVMEGGLRILKRWVELAKDEGNVEELKTIVVLCRRLPFDKVAAKETQIGKEIKKLQKKFDKKSNKDHLALHTEVDNLIKTWTEAASAPAESAPSEPAPASAVSVIVGTLGQRILEDRGMPVKNLPALVPAYRELASDVNEAKTEVSAVAAGSVRAGNKAAATAGGNAAAPAPKPAPAPATAQAQAPAPALKKAPAAAAAAAVAPKSAMQEQIAANKTATAAAAAAAAAAALAALLAPRPRVQWRPSPAAPRCCCAPLPPPPCPHHQTCRCSNMSLVLANMSHWKIT